MTTWDYDTVAGYRLRNGRLPRINTHDAINRRALIAMVDYRGHVWKPVAPYAWQCRECGLDLVNVMNVQIGGAEHDCQGEPVREHHVKLR